MTGGVERDLVAPHLLLAPEGQDDFVAFSRHARLQQPRCPLRENDLAMRGNMIAVRV